MSMAHAHHGRHVPRKRHSLLTLPALILAGGIALSFGFVAYVLWPRWPAEQISADAPFVPIAIGGATFNFPPAAIRRPVQRRPGTQDRVDLAFLWPSLAPPDPAHKPEPIASASALDRVFVTVAASDGLSPAERIKTIYPRYLDTSIATAPNGLAARPFKDTTPYKGETLMFDPADPERFTLRCSDNGKASTLGICFYERRIADADIVVRFPRDWLSDWQMVRERVEKLVENFRVVAR